MFIEVMRISTGNGATIGVMSRMVHRKRRFMAFTMECIEGMKEGEYRLFLNGNSRDNGTYSSYFPEFHRGMISFKDEDGAVFQIKRGNTVSGQDRGLIVGDVVSENLTKEGRLLSSDTAYERVYRDVIQAFDSGVVVKLRFVN